MTGDKLRAALELLPPTATLTLSRDELLEALGPSPDIGSMAAPIPAPDTMLTAEQVAAQLNTSERWVYDHAEKLGVKRLSRRCVRFSSAAVARFMSKRRPS